MYEGKLPQRRYNLTLKFLSKHISHANFTTPARLLDLGVRNPLAEQLENLGYILTNTGQDDLDEYNFSGTKKHDCCTAFEILEHLVNPYTVLKEIPSDYLCASVPLALWFSKPYRNKNDPRDQHFHEFYQWQFDMLLYKAGWDIIASEKWTNPTLKIGFRPLLRLFKPRYYIVFAKRKQMSIKNS